MLMKKKENIFFVVENKPNNQVKDGKLYFHLVSYNGYVSILSIQWDLRDLWMKVDDKLYLSKYQYGYNIMFVIELIFFLYLI